MTFGGIVPRTVDTTVTGLPDWASAGPAANARAQRLIAIMRMVIPSLVMEREYA
jgi:hypothetical protein